MHLTSKLSFKIRHFNLKQKPQFPYRLSKADIFRYGRFTHKRRVDIRWETSNQLLFFTRPIPQKSLLLLPRLPLFINCSTVLTSTPRILAS